MKQNNIDDILNGLSPANTATVPEGFTQKVLSTWENKPRMQVVSQKAIFSAVAATVLLLAINAFTMFSYTYTKRVANNQEKSIIEVANAYGLSNSGFSY